MSVDCPSCGGLNISCPDGCGRNLATGELDGSRLEPTPVDKDAPDLREALQQCANKFWEYVIIHEAKGPEGMEKAARNREMAELCEQALARQAPPDPLAAAHKDSVEIRTTLARQAPEPAAVDVPAAIKAFNLKHGRDDPFGSAAREGSEATEPAAVAYDTDAAIAHAMRLQADEDELAAPMLDEVVVKRLRKSVDDVRLSTNLRSDIRAAIAALQVTRQAPATVEEYLDKAIASYNSDAADTDFQRGYLEALKTVRREALR